VRRVALKYFGKDKVKEEGLPLTASEDFSYFLQEKPGCFFIFGTKKAGENYVLHTSHYDYNDSVIGTCAYFYVRLVEDRLNVSII
jgi:hippurate hydrolase